MRRSASLSPPRTRATTRSRPTPARSTSPPRTVRRCCRRTTRSRPGPATTTALTPSAPPSRPRVAGRSRSTTPSTTASTGTAKSRSTRGNAAKVVFTQTAHELDGRRHIPAAAEGHRARCLRQHASRPTRRRSVFRSPPAPRHPAAGHPLRLPNRVVAGVVTFSGCKIDKIGTGYKLHATDGSLTPDDSSTFNITLGPAAKLAFTQQPGSSTGGSRFPDPARVTVQDAGGNTGPATRTSVTVAIGTNAGRGGTLSGTKTDRRRRAASRPSPASRSTRPAPATRSPRPSGAAHGTATSNTFNITLGPAAKLAFTQQPGELDRRHRVPDAAEGDGPGRGRQHRTADTTTSVTVAIGTNPGPGGTLAGTKTVAAVAGVATFSGLSIDKTGTGYTLTAPSSAAHRHATSSTFNITLGPAAKLAFTQQPASSTGGVAFPTQPKVTVQDAGGNTRTADTDARSRSRSARTPAPAGRCRAPRRSPRSRVSRPSPASDRQAGTGYTLTAADGALTGDTSSRPSTSRSARRRRSRSRSSRRARRAGSRSRSSRWSRSRTPAATPATADTTLGHGRDRHEPGPGGPCRAPRRSPPSRVSRRSPASRSTRSAPATR